MIKVSIIVPTYNRAKYLPTCIDSLISQTLKDIEILIIDDGSKDNTKEIIEKYNDARIKYFYKKNSGIGDTRNFGIKKAKGECICFVDSDDYLDITMLEKCYNKLTRDNLDMVVCDYIEIDEETNDEVKYNINNFNDTTLAKTPSLILDVNLGPCNKVFKRHLFSNVLFPTDIKYEDMALVVKIMYQAKKIGKINEYLSYFLVHSNSETTTVDEKIFDIFVSLDMIRDTLKEDMYREVTNQLIINKLQDYNIQQRNQTNKHLRKKFIDASFRYLEEHVKDYKNAKYYKKESFPKSFIKKNINITKLYCNIYALVKNRK